MVDPNWLNNEFLSTVITRGAAVIKARKLSSAMSAAKAIADHIYMLHHGTSGNEFTSMAVYTSDNVFGVPNGLIFSLPVHIKNGTWTVADVKCNVSLAATIKELQEEQKEAMVHVE
eukprot:NODE_418_length_8967_cov_0.347429.p6 type:complete len:116 gc:universal NODE_418_length_8967_cov_0.347429:7587-7240(-)